MLELAPWHWLVLGVALILFELILPSFTALWFGVGALVVALVLLLAPELSVVMQLLIWTVASILFTFFWFRVLKPLSIDKTKAGLSKEAIVGEVGQVLSLPNEARRGKLRFPAPILGADEWLFICEQELAIGDRVRVIDISGNALIVCKQ